MASRPAVSEIEAVFREKGIPLTRQRAVIWAFFAGADRAATIAEAADALREQGVGQATVYRAVTLFTELGLLCRVQSRQGELCFTAPPIGHSHPLICGVCRRVVRFEGDGDLTALEAAAHGRDRLLDLRPSSRGLRHLRGLPREGQAE